MDVIDLEEAPAKRQRVEGGNGLGHRFPRRCRHELVTVLVAVVVVVVVVGVAVVVVVVIVVAVAMVV